MTNESEKIASSTVAEDVTSGLTSGLLAYAAGRAAALDSPPEPGSMEWTLAKLDGREFAEPNAARDFLRSELEAEKAAHAARQAEERAKRRRGHYQVSFTLITDDEEIEAQIYAKTEKRENFAHRIENEIREILQLQFVNDWDDYKFDDVSVVFQGVQP